MNCISCNTKSVTQEDGKCAGCMLLAKECRMCYVSWALDFDNEAPNNVCEKCNIVLCNNCGFRELEDWVLCPLCRGVTTKVDTSKPIELKSSSTRRRRQPTTLVVETPQKREDNIVWEDKYDDVVKKKYDQTITTDEIILAQIRNRLARKYGFEDPIGLLKTIHSTGSAILGCFVLEVLFAEDYTDSDLDIYANEHGAEQIRKFIPAGYAVKTKSTEVCEYIKDVDTYETSTRRIRLITMIHADLIDAHIDKVDATILQNKFDGRKLYIGDRETLEKRGTVLEYNQSRVLRYFERGFQLKITLTAELAQKLLK